MRRLTLLLLGLTALLIVWQCSDSSTEHEVEMRELTETEKRLVESDNLFGFNIFRQMASREQGKNMFISPLSISMALGMTMNGAEGATFDEMKEVLGFAGMESGDINKAYLSLITLLSGLDNKVTFEIANSIWTRDSFAPEVKEEFYQTNQDYFDAEVDAVDFSDAATVKRINDWVNSKTHGKIKKILDGPVDPLTMMILINAIYFKGDWTITFPEDKTQDDTFYLQDDSEISHPLMYLKEDFRYFSTEEMQAIELPYGDGDFSMVVLLPALNDIATDVDEFADQITAEKWAQWMDRFSEREIELYLPKFELEYKKTLNEILQSMGMVQVFDAQLSDFTGIAEVEDLHITEVLHKTYVKVDERGTEAAAVTSVTIGTTSINPEENTMRVNRPFIFAIKENSSGAMIFMGKVVDPS